MMEANGCFHHFMPGIMYHIIIHLKEEYQSVVGLIGLDWYQTIAVCVDSAVVVNFQNATDIDSNSSMAKCFVSTSCSFQNAVVTFLTRIPISHNIKVVIYIVL